MSKKTLGKAIDEMKGYFSESELNYTVKSLAILVHSTEGHSFSEWLDGSIPTDLVFEAENFKHEVLVSTATIARD